MATNTVRARLDWGLVLRKADLPPRVLAGLKHEFERPNPKFFKAQAMGYWVGNIPRVIRAWEEDERFLVLPRAAAPVVRSALESTQMELEVEDDTVATEPAGLKLRDAELYPHQETATGVVHRKGGGIVTGPCGCGKTVFLLAAIARLNQRAIVVVHNGPLMNQWIAAVGEWLGIAPGTVGGGHKMDVNRPVVVAMQQSLARLAKMGSPPAWTDGFGVLAGDEVHHWAASTFQAVGRMFRARHFIGVSADEKRKDGLDFLIHWTFGEVVHAISRDDLVSVGRLVPIRMYVVPTSYQDELYLETVGNDESPDWVGMVSRMMDVRRTAGLERAKVVWKVVERIVKDVPGARVLVLNDRVEACRMMVEQFGMMGLRAGLLIGGQENKKELERTKAGLQGGRLDVGVGTTIADEGLDIPALTHVVVTSPVAQHPRRLEQMVGRAARPWPGKERAVAVYIWDRLMFPSVPADDIKRDRLEAKFLERLGAVVPDVRLMERVDFAGE